MVKISQYIHISNHYVLQLKLIEIISQSHLNKIGGGKSNLEREEVFTPICLGDPESECAMHVEDNY